MSDIKLKPNRSLMHIDTSLLTLSLPDISFIIPNEPKPLNVPITIFKKPVKSNSNSLF